MIDFSDIYRVGRFDDPTQRMIADALKTLKNTRFFEAAEESIKLRTLDQWPTDETADADKLRIMTEANLYVKVLRTMKAQAEGVK